jgi:hypothetical protein
MEGMAIESVRAGQAAGFGAVSAVSRTGPGDFTAQVDGQWTIAGRPNGGYLLAILGRAATEVAAQPHPLAASAHFLRAPEPGQVEVRVEQLRASRSSTQLRATLSQGGAACTEALFTVSTLPDGDTVYWDGGMPRPGPADRSGGYRLPPVTPAGTPALIMDQVEIRLDAESARFAGAGPSGRGELRGWLTLPHDEPFDLVSLLYAVDAFPPATFDIAPSGWVPTLELTAYLRARPAPGPVWVRQKAQLIDGQRVDEVCHVWDVTGRLVAQATQLAGIRIG